MNILASSKLRDSLFGGITPSEKATFEGAAAFGDKRSTKMARFKKI
jgi:hypothetical protein